MIQFPPKIVSYTLYKIPTATKYTSFEIPKRSGGIRIIHAPIAPVKQLQKALAELLTVCNAEIAENKPRVRTLAHGFTKGQSIITNAWPHTGRRFVLNLDLQDFFPSINFGRIRGYFIKQRDYVLHPAIATIIAQIASFDNSLPQGSPCSPIISNMLAHPLDIRLVRLASDATCSYTRYADDITFSTNKKQFPIMVATQESESGGSWNLSARLVAEITRAGFTINAEKTRMQTQQSKQVVTGLTVNAKVNIQASYYRAARQMCTSMFRRGTFHRPSDKTSESTVEENNIAYLEGVMAHIYHIKHSYDVRAGVVDKAKEEKNNKKRYPAYRELYKKLLYFKHFVTLDRPLIICEGKTDDIYLHSALRSLVSSYPDLATLDDGRLRTKVRFLRHSRAEHDILELTGGSNNLAKFIGRYFKSLINYHYRPLKFPVIILIDNDTGSGPVFSSVRENSEARPGLLTTDKFYHLGGNLYLIKTPEIGPSGSSCIEDLFDKALRDTVIDGRTFNPDEKADSNKFYPKMVFADQVVRRNAAKIDFSGFNTIFERINAAVLDHKI